MSRETNHGGRPPAVAPAGRVTIKQAAETAGVSYATAYRAVKRGDVRSETAPNGEIYVARADVAKLKPRPRERADHPSVTVRLEDGAHLERWRRAARGHSLQEWLTSLGDKAAAK